MEDYSIKVSQLVPENLRNTEVFSNIIDIFSSLVSDSYGTSREIKQTFDDLHYYNSDYTKLSYAVKIQKIKDLGFSYLLDVFQLSDLELSNLLTFFTVIKAFKCRTEGFKIILDTFRVPYEYHTWDEVVPHEEMFTATLKLNLTPDSGNLTELAKKLTVLARSYTAPYTYVMIEVTEEIGYQNNYFSAGFNHDLIYEPFEIGDYITASSGFSMTIDTRLAYDEVDHSENVRFYYPIATAGTYSNPVRIDWGDGTKEIIRGGAYPYHDYDKPGVYEVILSLTDPDHVTPRIVVPSITSASAGYEFPVEAMSTCKKITSLNTPIDKYGETTLEYAFTELTNLTYITPSLLAHCGNVTTISHAFEQLPKIPAGFLDGLVSLTNANYAFYKFGGEKVPYGLFKRCLSLYSLTYAFAESPNLVEIESEFFSFEGRSYSVSASYLDYCFANCPKLSKLPEHFIYIYVVRGVIVDGSYSNWCTVGNIRLVNTFEGCKSLRELPKHLVYIDSAYSYHNQHVAMYETFKDCGIVTITQPIMYLKSHVYPYQMTGTFVGCHDLTTITSTLVEGQTYPETTSHWCSIWQDTFRGCKSLENVTHRLDIACQIDSLFDGTFADCTSLKRAVALGNRATYISTYSNSSVESIDSEFFTGLSYASTFADCTNLVTIEKREIGFTLGSSNSTSYTSYFRDTLYRAEVSHLFSSRYSATEVFKNCISLKDAGNIVLFKGDGVFEGCTSLEKFNNFSSSNFLEIPNCFKGCTALKQIGTYNNSTFDVSGDFTGTFEGCTSLEDLGEIISKFYITDRGIEVKLDRTFKDCTSLTMEFPKWWEAITPENSNTNYTSHVDTFEGCVNLANYNEIPDDWK